MARQETIEVILKRAGNYESTVKSLQAEADKLKETFGSIKVGDSVNAIKAQASASKEAAKAAQEQAKADKEAANAEKARYQAVKELENATKAHLSAQKEAQSVTSEQMRAQREVARATAEWAKASKEATNAETAQIRQTQLLSRESERQATAMRRLGDAVGSVNKDQATSIQYMTEWIHQQQGMANATVTATGAIHNSAGSFQTYNAAVTEAGGVTHNYRFAVENAEGAVYQLDKGIKTTTVSIRDLSSVLRAVRTVIGFTGIAQSLRSAFSEMKDMSDQLAEYRKVTGATAQEMEQIRATAYDIAKSYGESASDVIASAANMARAGYRENSVAMAELATKTKLVGDMTQEAADKFLIAVDAAYKYKGNVEQLSAVLDAANALDNQYATTIEKISDGMTLISSLAATAHVPIEQLMAALGTMTAVTQRSGTETARGLRSIFLNIIGDTSTEIEDGVTATEEGVKTMSDILNKYAKDVVIAARESGKLINPMEAIVALQKAWKDNQISEADLNKISNALGGKRYYNVFTALIDNPEMYNDMLQSISQSVGSAQSEIDILMDSWSRKLEQLKTTWTELVNKSITEGFVKNLIDGVSAALKFAGSLENLAATAGSTVVVIRALSTGIKNLETARMSRMLGFDVSGNGAQIFGAANIATAIGAAAVAAIGIIKSAYEENQRKIQEEAQKTVESAIASATTYNSLEELTKRYEEIANDGIQREQGELEELKTLQDQLNGLVGDQADAIDIVNGKYGDTIVALQKLTKEQREAAKNEAANALTKAVNAWNASDLNGFFKFGGYGGYSNTGISFTQALPAIVSNYIAESSFLKLFSDRDYSANPTGAQGLFFNKPDTAESIVQFYEELKALQVLMGSTKTEYGKTVGEVYSGFYNSLSSFLNTVEPLASTVKTAQEHLDSFNEELEEVGETNGSANEAAGAIDDLTESVDSLSDSIDKATKAKEKFDDAMKTTKADAFNDYMEAFNTFKGELDAGRVNSTAMYAAARMMLGEDAYAAAGGTYQGVMAAMNAKGSAGSVLDAYNILNTKYQDEKGNAVEGFGVYELIRQSGVIDERLLRDSVGNYFIPDLTDAQISQISAAYGGVLEEVIINALNAFDQYDIYGDATDSDLQAKKKTAEEETNEDLDTFSDSIETATKGVDKFAEHLAKIEEERATQTEYPADDIVDATTSGGTYNWKNTAKRILGGVSDAFSVATEAAKAASAEKTAEAQQKATEAAKAAAEALDTAIARLEQLNATGGNADIIAMINGLDGLKETYTIAIESAEGNGTTEEKLTSIASALNDIEKEKEIAISVGIPGAGEAYDAAKEALLGEANALISDVQDEDTLHDIACTLVADDGTTLNRDVDDLIRNRQADIIKVQVQANTAPAKLQIGTVEIAPYNATVGVSADTDKAKETIDAVTSADYPVTVNVSETGAEETGEKIQGISDGAYDANIAVDETGSQTAKEKIESVATDYPATITTTESGSAEAGKTIDAVSSADYPAKITVKESGTATARERITDVANGKYDATINVDDKGTAQNVIDKIDTALEKLGYVEDVDVDQDIEDLVDALNAIKETYTVTVKEGEGTAAVSARILGISDALETIDKLKDAGIIDVDFATETSADLLEEANAVVDSVNSDEELEEIWISLEGDEYPITKEIFDLLHKKRDDLRLNVKAETTDAETKIESVEKGPYSATVNTTETGSEDAKSAINAAADGPYSATINTGESGSSDAKGAIQSAAYGPYNANINTAESGSDDAKETIETASEGPFTATINTSEDGSKDAKDTIEKAAKGPYDSTISVAQTGVDTVEKQINHAARDRSTTIKVTTVSTETSSHENSIGGQGDSGAVPYTSSQFYGGGANFSSGYSGGSSGNYFQDFWEHKGVLLHATGTQFHPGGISLVNDGNGPELLVDRGRAFIANGGKPALVNLEKGAKVFTASETREILGNGVPAYAFGTKNIALTDGGGTSRTTNYGVKSITAVGAVTAVPDETTAQETAAETAAAQAASATFSSLKDLIDHIIDRIGLAIDEQEELIDKQIAELKAQREATKQQNELEEKQKAVADAMGQRTVRYIDENGQWHWMADANKVQKAQKDLADYEDELAFNAQIQALEDQKTALEEEYKKITKAWSDIQYAVNTPTGDLTQLLSQVIATGSATDKKGAETVQNLLITQLLKGGIFSENYTEALDSIEKATAGNPIMPGESESTLASLIATASGMGTGTEVADAMKATAIGSFIGSGYAGVAGEGTQINYNYFVNGIQLGSDQANEPLSSIMRTLTVYTNTGVA